MPVLKNARHERFAQDLAKGKTAEKAYVDAGYKANRHNAAALAREQHISTRVSELQAPAVKRTEITVQSLADELEEARAIALAEKQSSAAVSATMGKAKLFGLGVENRRLTGTLQLITITPQMIEALTPDERALFRSAIPLLDKLGFFAGHDRGSGAEGGGEQED